MKTYTVKEIAKILDVTEEQVRRWIRNKTLKATIRSKKEGYIICENELTVFIKEHSKYDKTVTLCLGSNYNMYLNGMISELERLRNSVTLLIETLKSQIEEP